MLSNRLLLILTFCTSLLLTSCGNALYSSDNTHSAEKNKDNFSIDIPSTSQPMEIQSDEKEGESSDKAQQAAELYQYFLNGEITIDEIDIDSISIPTGEPEKRYQTFYAYSDMNGDGVDELHVNSGRHYYIFTFDNDKLKVWKYFSPYPYYYTLQNGAVMSHRMGTAPMEDNYAYIIFDYFGNEVWRTYFSKYDSNQNGIYDFYDDFLFEGVSVTKEQWERLTERFLYYDENGIERIRNEIEWHVLIE